MKILTEEHKQNIRMSRLGKTHDEETKMKISKTLKGRIFDEEWRNKLSKAALGNKNHQWKDGRTMDMKHYKKMAKIKRRYLEQETEGQFTKDEWERLKKQYHYTCPSCRASEPDIKLTIDHITPLIKGGTNWIGNIQPLCNSCNGRKRTKIIRFS